MSSKKILITGASTGFGNITAKLLAKQGHTVYATMRDISGKNKPHKEALIDWAKAEQVDVKVVELDVTSDQSVENAKHQILTETNRSMDVIVNNAGIYGGGIQEAYTVNDHKAFFDVNVFGAVRVNNAFLPILRTQGSGLIVQISSVLGRSIIPFGGVYDATKWALEALSENLAYELRPLGIDVAIVEPGAFLTEIMHKQYQPENSAVVAEYGKTIEYMNGFYNAFSQMLTDPNIPNKPEQVAEAILNLVNLPNGKRPLRIVVDKMMGGVTEIINDTSSKVQAGLLQNFGLTELNINN